MGIETVTRRAGYKRGTYYLHIKKKDLSATILYKYGKAIHYDFSEEVPEVSRIRTKEPEEDYIIEPITMREAIVQMNEWKDKYYSLLEKYLSLVEKEKRS